MILVKKLIVVFSAPTLKAGDPREIGDITVTGQPKICAYTMFLESFTSNSSLSFPSQKAGFSIPGVWYSWQSSATKIIALSRTITEFQKVPADSQLSFLQS